MNKIAAFAVVLSVASAGMLALAFASANISRVGIEAERGATADIVQPDVSASGGSSIRFGNPASDLPLVVFDTDMGPDIDDALALAMLHEYVDQQQVELAAVTISRNSTTGARYADVINTHYGHGDIPIGMYYGGTQRDGGQGDLYSGIENSHPNDIRQPIEDGFKTIRRVLARAEAESRRVIIIQTGFSGNLSRLVDSGPDGMSPKSGLDLIRSRVDMLGIMAGHFNHGKPEFNIEKDLSSAKNLFNKWPVDMVVSDWRIGGNLVYPYEQGVRDNLSTDHPVRIAYETNEYFGWHPKNPSGFYNMWSWDLTSVLDAIESEANYFGRSQRGTVILDSQGVTTFRPSSGGKHRHLIIPSNKQRTINRMIDLVN